ncbi:DUF1254 domain-containing protein [Buttiauxella sp. B2]|uniref:DUF1254 domain-containing protein n=1 Tax=Buttiauxella sp. B2 TaxID=2587812 RepID=UPI00167655AA|nr:DUF1254 domain-containing protein [Buttiauxella sp. B2]
MQNDDFTDQVFYSPGAFDIKSQTKFAAIIVRTQVNPSDPEDINSVHQLQNNITVTRSEGTKVKDYKPVN